MKNWNKVALVAAMSTMLYFSGQKVVRAYGLPCGGALQTPTLSLASTSTTTAKQYSVDCLPPLTPATSGKSPSWWIFCSTGDGRFYMNSQAAFEAMAFAVPTYSTATTLHDPFVEYIALYDDTQNPKHTHRSANTSTVGYVDPIPSNDPLAVPGLSTKGVNVQSSCDPSPDDSLIYVVTYQKPGPCTAGVDSIIFQNDKDLMDYLSFEGFGHELLSNTTTAPGNLVFIVDKPNQNFQRNIFLMFKTKPSALLGAPSKVKAIYKSNSKDCPIYTDVMSSQTIVATHDPNHKSAVSPNLQKDKTGHHYVDFRVEIQNEGSDSTKTVYVDDILDTLLDNTAPKVLSSSTGQLPVVTKVGKTGRKYRFDFGNLTLHGLHENGLGTVFKLADTKASFTFHCAMDPVLFDKSTFINAYSCNAICNEAQVKFDCNPLFNTNVALAHFLCNDTLPTCTLLKDTAFALTAMPPGVDLLTAYISKYIQHLYPSKKTKFKWYPTQGLIKPFNLEPGFFPSKQFEYTLVASDSCNNYSVFHIKLPCTLGITIDPCSVPGYLVATATGNLDHHKLQWSNRCILGDTCHILAPRRQMYYVGVTDISTGCTAEITYFDYQNCNHPFSWYYYVTVGLASLLVIGLVFAIMVYGRKK